MFSYLRPNHKRPSPATTPDLPPLVPSGSYPQGSSTYAAISPPSHRPPDEHDQRPHSSSSQAQQRPLGPSNGDARMYGPSPSSAGSVEGAPWPPSPRLQAPPRASTFSHIVPTMGASHNPFLARRPHQPLTTSPATYSATSTSSRHEGGDVTSKQRPHTSGTSEVHPPTSYEEHHGLRGQATTQTPAHNVVSHQSRPSKTKFNLLNPVSLLMRRRSPQSVGLLSNEYSHSNPRVPAMDLPDDYDPRIRGKGVHDFSAPRPRNTLYNSRPPIHLPQTATTEPQQYTRPSPSDRLEFHADISAHTNADVELSGKGAPATAHIGDTLAVTSAPKPSGSLHHQSAASVGVTQDHQHVPGAQANKLYIHPSASSHPNHNLTHIVAEAQSEPGKDHGDTPEKSTLSDLSAPPSAVEVPEPGSPKLSGTEPAFQPLGLPKHLSSTASRFSFDLAGVGSAAQEKLLEERHAKHATARKLARASPESDYSDTDISVPEDIDPYAYDDMDECDGFEEKIPGVNVDAEDEGLYLEPHALFDFKAGASGLMSPVKSSPEMIMTPRDAEGQVIGFALSKESPGTRVNLIDDFPANPPISSTLVQEQVASSPAKISSPDVDSQAVRTELTEEAVADDLYFDDGAITHPETDVDGPFDESVFDEDAKTFNKRNKTDTLDCAGNLQEQVRLSDDLPSGPARVKSCTCTVLVGDSVNDGSSPCETHQPPSLPIGPLANPQAGLTHDNLDHLTAYHDALAAAANAAAADGRFSHDSRALLDARLGNSEVEAARPASDEYNFESANNFDDQDMFEDDTIIAAANAEALENDDDGFYGQEFGFYAQASGGGEAEYIHGGYFGQRGADGVTRSQSGRVAFREPNLTPITERSEYSNRNSFMAPHSLYGSQSAHSVQNPGLAQLADMMGSFHEEDLTMGSLMKLRRGAWGGSNGSLRSAASTGSQASGGGPLSYLPPLNTNPITSAAAFAATAGIGTAPSSAGAAVGPILPSPNISSPSDVSPVTSSGLASSTGSILPSEMDVSVPESPTITQLSSSKPHQARSMNFGVPFASSTNWNGSPPEHGASASGDVHRRSVRKGHQRTDSRDSVSYVEEEDDETGVKRWIMEKRRTTEEGEVEIVEREVIEGGTI